MSGFTKKKSKRSRSDSSENNSFIQNISSRISSYLPASVTKWFGSPGSSNEPNHTNGSVPATEIDVDKSEEATESQTITMQPLAKRMKLSSPPRNNLDFGPMMSTSISDLETMQPNKTYNGNNYIETHLSSADEASSSTRYSTNLSHMSDLPQKESSFRTGHSKHLIDSPLSETSSEESETAYKPVYKRKPIRSISRTYSDTLYPSNPLTTTPLGFKSSTSIDTPKKLSTSETTEPTGKNTSGISREQNIQSLSFKPCLLGSPFYSGRTTYGGASSTHVNRPNIFQWKPAVVHETSKSDNTTSHAAQKVKNLLELISSPMSESGSISVVQADHSRENFLNRLRNMSTMPEQRNAANYYRNQQLHSPTVASVLRLKTRSRLMDTTKLARQIIASHSSTSDIVPCITNMTNQGFDLPKSNQKFTTKMKTSLTRQKRGEDLDEVFSERPNIPNVPLQIDQSKLANISFGIQLASAPSPIPKTKATPPITNENSSFTNTNNTGIKFSTPMKLSEPIPLKKTSHSHGFTFGNPERSVERFDINHTDKPKSEEQKEKGDLKTKQKDWQCGDCWVNNKDETDKCCCCGGKKSSQKTSETVQPKEPKTTKTKGRDWQCNDCWVNNKDDADKCVCCGGKKPSKEVEIDKCTVCKMYNKQPSSNLCETCQKVKSSNNLPLPKPQNSGKWQCSTCWVSNDVSAQKCASCGEVNAKVAPVPTANHAEEKWKCNDCWIRNNASDSKCASCGASKPGTTTKLTNQTKPKTNSLNESNLLIKDSVSGTWECSNCLVANDSKKLKCGCCEHPKPGLEKVTDKSPFNFALKPNVTFKFGIDPNAQTQSIPADNMTDTEPKVNEEQSETNNNIVPKVPTFSFGVPAKKPEEAATTDQVDSQSKSNFSFGVPTGSKLPTFGLTNKVAETPATDTETKERPQEVPKVDLLAQKPQEEIKSPPQLKVSSNSFFLPIASQENTEIKKSPADVLAPMFGIPFGQDKKLEKPAALITFGIPTSTTSSEVKGFTFSNTISKPAASVIEPVSSLTLPAPTTTLQPALETSAPAPVIAPTVISTTASFTVPAPFTFTFQKSATSTPAPSLFQTPNASSTMASMFKQKAEPLPATTPASVPASTAPFYSFGSTPAAPNANTEKPKFNFTFGKAPESESSPMFKFGATNDTSANANTFQMPTGNGLGANTISFGGVSVLGGTGLTGHTPMSSGNTLESGGLSAPTGIFNTNKDTNMWNANNSTGMVPEFGSSSNTELKPAPFAFGATTFGSAPTQSMFGTPVVNTGGSLFGSPAQPSATQTSLFGNSPAPSTGMFGTPTPTFGAPNPSMSSFEAPSLPQAPAFNFGAAPSTGMFAFGQQGTPAQASSVYAFGGGGGVPTLQFNMGSAPAAAPAARRVRKATRRIPR